MKLATVTLLAACLAAPVAAGRSRLRSQKVASSSFESMIADLKSSMERKEQERDSDNRTVASLFPFYHSSAQIHDELTAMVSRCPQMSIRSVAADANTNIDVINVKDSSAQPVNKNFFLFGEHARELISPEAGLHLIKALCGEKPDLADKAKKVLQDSEFEIVINGNPHSRAKVEQGDFCLRVNENGVDLNRNWDEEWQPTSDFAVADTNPGSAPFSEPETQVFKQLVSDYQPTNFLTVHSGTRGMYMPWAYDMEHLAKRNQPEMMNILRTLDSEYCECPFGAAGKEVGYSCPGTCLDWVYDKLKTPYSFAWEIYTGPEYDSGLKERFEQKMHEPDSAFIQKTSHLAHEHFHETFTKNPSDFVQLKSNRAHHRSMFDMDPMECFGRFNPDNEEAYTQTVGTWTNAFLDLASMVSTNLKGGAGAANMTMTQPVV